MIFITCPKSFKVPLFKKIQVNALVSWIELYPTASFLLFCEDLCLDSSEKYYELFKKMRAGGKLKYIDSVKGIDGVPYISGIFDEAFKIASDDEYVVYINSDIILFSDFKRTLDYLNLKISKKKRILFTGSRWDWSVPEEIDFLNNNWDKKIRDQVLRCGCQHKGTGKDYFVVNKRTYKIYPNFLIGRFYWDAWIHRMGLNTRNVFFVDMTKTTLVVHQDHQVDIRKEESFSEQQEYNRILYKKNRPTNRIKGCNNYFTDNSSAKKVIIKSMQNKKIKRVKRLERIS